MFVCMCVCMCVYGWVCVILLLPISMCSGEALMNHQVLSFPVLYPLMIQWLRFREVPHFPTQMDELSCSLSETYYRSTEEHLHYACLHASECQQIQLAGYVLRLH